MFLIIGGTVEITISGKATRLGPGSAAFVAANEEHGLHNAGSDQRRSFVVRHSVQAE